VARKYNRQSSCMKPIEPKAAHHAYFEEALFEAIITACAVVAFADGQVHYAEREEIIKLIDRSIDLSTYTTTETGEAFDSRIRELIAEYANFDLLAMLLKRCSRACAASGTASVLTWWSVLRKVSH
jgi:tellurite resistance protein